ncbi:MAG: hypothetical protein PF693_17445 [Spirochaetia bacterium]|jgi:hypothetical protein|nr:hypothetical protein [Spirochaetia bacterium]
MNWKKKLGKGFNQGIDQSKILLEKAKQQALELGERTVLDTEIKELTKNEDELYGLLGREVYALLVNRGRSSVSVRTPEIKDFFPELERLISDLATKNMLVQKVEKKDK